MRDTIFLMIQKAKPGDHVSKIYDIFITIVAIASIIPLTFKHSYSFFDELDIITVYILFLDYVLRWIVCDYTAKKKGVTAFIKYPFTPFAVIDLLSLLPSLGLIDKSFRILRMMRIFKILHYSESFLYISKVFRKERKTLVSVLIIALTYIFISALAMFSYEPDSFETFFHALYWATSALTTVGYGDIYPRTPIGQFISMVSSLFGIAIIALPAGIVTGGFVEEITQKRILEEEAHRERRENTDEQ